MPTAASGSNQRPRGCVPSWIMRLPWFMANLRLLENWLAWLVSLRIIYPYRAWREVFLEASRFQRRDHGGSKKMCHGSRTFWRGSALDVDERIRDANLGITVTRPPFHTSAK